MNEKLTVEKEPVVALYDSQEKKGKELLERVFGIGTFKPRPVGIYCLATDGAYCPAKDWKPCMTPQGVLVVTEESYFILGLHIGVSLQYGAMDQAKSPLSQDKESFDSKAATDAMIAAYKGTHYKDKDGEIWDVYGAPAAEFCREFSFGSIPAGEWDLPTLAVVKYIQANYKAINECILAMGLPKYRLIPSWLQSSIESSESCAWCVYLYGGFVLDYLKYYYHTVRAVSAFRFSTFNF